MSDTVCNTDSAAGAVLLDVSSECHEEMLETLGRIRVTDVALDS